MYFCIALTNTQLWVQRYKYNTIQCTISAVFFCIDHFQKSGRAKVIDNTLGIRSNLAKYCYSEIFESMMAIYLTGGSRIEDAKRLSAQFSEKSQGYRLCSPDTILKTLSDKAEEDTFVESGEGNRYKFSINAGLSGLLLDGMLECGQIDEATHLRL